VIHRSPRRGEEDQIAGEQIGGANRGQPLPLLQSGAGNAPAQVGVDALDEARAVQPGLGETKAAPDAFESFSVMLEAQTAYTALAEMLQGEGWSVSEVRPHLKKLARALSPVDARRLFDLLQEIAALRLLKVDLHWAGFAPTRAVAYRDASGEVVYTAPVYG
jgi:hypothetical protein